MSPLLDPRNAKVGANENRNEDDAARHGSACCPPKCRHLAVMIPFSRGPDSASVALPRPGKPPPSPQPDGPPGSTNLVKYQGLEALTQRAVHRPDSSDVDDSSRLAEW